jgi:hypothetical protein
LSSLRRRIDEAFYGPKGVADDVRRLVQEAEVRGDKPTLRLVDLLRARVAGGEDVDDAERRRITEDALSSDTFPEFRKHRDALVASIWPSTPVTD